MKGPPNYFAAQDTVRIYALIELVIPGSKQSETEHNATVFGKNVVEPICPCVVTAQSSTLHSTTVHVE
jgi:hypothetical protein